MDDAKACGPKPGLRSTYGSGISPIIYLLQNRHRILVNTLRISQLGQNRSPMRQACGIHLRGLTSLFRQQRRQECFDGVDALQLPKKPAQH
jgi:hypothetical protein